MTPTTQTSLSPALPAGSSSQAPAALPVAGVLPDTLTVVVTEEDILLGRRRCPSQCPIARALRRTLTLMGQPPMCVVVGSERHGCSTVSVDSYTRLGMYRFRPEGWIEAFDHGDEDPEPRSFELVKL